MTQTRFSVESIGLLATAALLLIWPWTPVVTLTVVALMLVVGLLNVAGTAVLYHAFRVGRLALVAPIISGDAVITALVALLSGERPALLSLQLSPRYGKSKGQPAVVRLTVTLSATAKKRVTVVFGSGSCRAAISSAKTN